MTTTIAIFTSIRNATTGKRESIMVLPEFAHLYNEDNFIVAYYVKHAARYVTVPGTEFADVKSKWLAQFEISQGDKMPSKLQQVRIPLPPNQVAELSTAAAAQGISTAELIRRTLVSAGIITEPKLTWGKKSKQP